ncbi:MULTISPECIES: histidine kinase dimerization/phospho-acceptor domain-containing protein [unclassified Nocardioides]|uniref:histidine kinase dimerization/phospho-acceptor domain-containing protein n=1 Tax=unclassified Nocardioides TaxID=2615069 RepID=UPI003614E332
MRERLTAAFIILTIVLLLGAGLVRTFVLRDMVREQVAGQLDQQASLVAAIVADRQAAGGAVDEEMLQKLVGPDDRLVLAVGDSEIVVTGEDYEDDDGDDISATAVVDGAADTTVTVSEPSSVANDVVGRDLGSIAALFLLIAVVAGLAGLVIAALLSAPFQKLAVAAAALGRGRFDLDLPETRIPEARAIANALRSSALALEDRVHRERAFAEHASHVLRTPLTGIRLELEDLSMRDDLPEDAQETVTRCLARVEQVATVAAELVEITRRGSLVVGAEVPLSELSTQLAQRWADRLAARNRALTAAVEGDLTLTYTPGPVEHATDLLLADVVRRGKGAVRIVFHGDPAGHLRIHVLCADRTPEKDLDGESLDRMSQVRVVVEALGGRVTGDHPADGVDVILPRR